MPIDILNPIALPRPRGSNRYDFESFKLGRHVTVYGQLAMLAALNLEANPDYLSYCEYPVAEKIGKQLVPIHFWAKRIESAEAWYLSAGEPDMEMDEGQPTDDLPAALANWVKRNSLEVRMVRVTDLKTSPWWIANWSEIIACLAANGKFITPEQREIVLQQCSAPTSARTVCDSIPSSDRGSALAVVYSLLQSGQLTCPTLETESLSVTSSISRTA